MARLPLLGTFALILLWGACDPTTPTRPVPPADEERIRAELRDRSFRQFVPSRDASPRKAVILDFFRPIAIWAQYAVGDHTVHEWEISADDYRLAQHGGGSEITIRLDAPRSRQMLPTACDDCIPTAGVSISIRHLFDPARLSFRVNDPNGVLPLPFPVFATWTRFAEDEIVE